MSSAYLEKKGMPRYIMRMINSLLLLLILSATVQIQAQEIKNFHEVVPGKLYRGAQPSYEEIKALKAQGVKTILDLRKDDSLFEDHTITIEDEEKFAQSLGMNFVSVPLDGFDAPKDSDINTIEYNVLNNPSLQPVFVHCYHGEDRTGLVIGLYRVLFQGVDPKQAYEEMKQLGYHWYLLGLTKYYKWKTKIPLLHLAEDPQGSCASTLGRPL